MQNVENMEPGSQLSTARNIVSAKQAKKTQFEGRAPDFLMDVMTKFFEPANQGSAESQEGSGELNKPGLESSDRASIKSATPKDQSENKPSVDFSMSLSLGNPDLSDQIKERGDGDQENEELLLAAVPHLSSLFEGKGKIMMEIPNKAEEVNSSLTSPLLLNKEEGTLIQFDPSAIGGTPGGSGGPGEGSLGSVDPNQKNTAEGGRLKESPDQKEGLNFRLDDNLLLNKWKKFAEKIAQTLTTGTSQNIAESEEGQFGSENPIEPAFGKENIQGMRLPTEIFKEPTTPDRQPSHSTVHSILMEKLQGAPSEKEKERPQGFSLSLEGLIGDPGGPFGAKDRESSEMTLDFEGLNKRDLLQNEELPKGNVTDQTHIHPINLTDRLLWDSTGTVKIINEKGLPLDHFPKSFELDPLKDHYFTLKKQTPSLMEISLEPAGLGKLDIELRLTQDRLQGQIMVNDNAGKQLIERNLPQLLSDLAHDGLQIGGFTVSLKNQGRGQIPTPIGNDYKEPSSEGVGPEQNVWIQGHHLIHIII